MKKIIGLILTALLIIIFIIPSTHSANAMKWLEVCRLCGGNGAYHCTVCNNTGKVKCDGCNGLGTWVCNGEEGKTRCLNGYYTCPSCHGDTYIRSGDGNIPPDAEPGTCGTCSGTGKIECIHCHGKGGGICDSCNGTGKSECQVGTCQVSRQYNWHCPNCKGTGYILTGNPMPPLENNDGIRNIPENGDMIFTASYDGTYYIYGGTQTQTEAQTQAQTQAQSHAQTEAQTQTQSQTKEHQTEIKTEKKTEKETQTVDLSILPDDRTNDYDIISFKDLSKDMNATVRIDMNSMSSDDKRIYSTLGDNELATIITNVKTIVSSAEPGRSDPTTDKILENIAKTNGFEDLNEGRIYPLYFEGHQEIGFPVQVTVTLERGQLDGGTNIIVYHITNDGEIENLGEGQVITYDDGSINQITFNTKSFSTFFTASKELTIEPDVVIDIEKQEETIGANSKPSNSSSTSSAPWIILVVVLIITAITAVIFWRKNRK